MRALLRVFVLLVVFAAGVGGGILWKSRKTPPVVVALPAPPVSVAQKPAEDPWPLTTKVVSRSLQSRSFSSDKLRRNSNDEVVWRWLKESIAKYPQNWVKLDIVDSSSYGVVLYPIETLDRLSLISYNRELKSKGLPLLEENKPYMRIGVYKDDIICPNWTGFIDLKDARLAYFVGVSA